MASHLTKLMRAMLESDFETPGERAWRPAVDVYRCGHGWLVKCDLAGVRIEDVQLSVNGGRLVIRGMRRDWAIHEAQQSYSMEIAYNRFERSVELPGNLETANISTDYRDGMLLIRLDVRSDSE